ncbi:unnamed protein product [Protopolystoma xenopodis]|uniref:Uncharacterized protein n=1 Tax=Protopolystoma xenopodis TaxID=117903 RepID=A0A3S5AW41_9PLAT|nr:unnamed protein product [Protopolystoma xenopodis]
MDSRYGDFGLPGPEHDMVQIEEQATFCSGDREIGAAHRSHAAALAAVAAVQQRYAQQHQQRHHYHQPLQHAYPGYSSQQMNASPAYSSQPTAGFSPAGCYPFSQSAAGPALSLGISPPPAPAGLGGASLASAASMAGCLGQSRPGELGEFYLGVVTSAGNSCGPVGPGNLAAEEVGQMGVAAAAAAAVVAARTCFFPQGSGCLGPSSSSGTDRSGLPGAPVSGTGCHDADTLMSPGASATMGLISGDGHTGRR